jgi:phosphoglycerol transferase MdoB-like AlkP superfamily enzyme
MNSRFKFLVSYLIFWIGILVSGKILFLLYFGKKTIDLGILTIAGIFYHGAKLDLSFIGYVFIFPLLTLFITSFFSGKTGYYALKIYNYILLIIAPFLVISDLVLYKFWGFRLDNSPMLYIKNPDEMIASVSIGLVILGILSSAALSILLIYLYNLYSGIYLKKTVRASLLEKIVIGLLIPLLIIPVRGGFNTSPVNLSTAYFCSDNFANHAAINLYWNLGYSFSNREDKHNPYIFYDSDSAQLSFRKSMNQSVSDKSFLSCSRPNVILIIIESFTSKIIEPLGGIPQITPGFNHLSTQGISFTHLYANGDRSDKGIVALFSGFPALGRTSVMKFPDKAGKLPNIARDMKKTGYHLSFYYGGDIEFFNLKSYLIASGFSEIISEKQFGSERSFSKWGVPDEFVFDKLYHDILTTTDTPFFKSMFTLSNHEPFDIPGKARFPGNDATSKFYSSAYYTDSCLTDFIAKIRKTTIWDHSLIILVADHGSRLPDILHTSTMNNYSIPMLWLGGAIQKDTLISRFGDQADLSKTLLNQLKMNTDQYRYSQDLFSDDNGGFAIYAFNDGFGFVTDSVKYIYDNQAKKITAIDGKVTGQTTMFGKSFLQLTYEDFLSR